MIAQTVRFALDHGYHVVLEGIMHTSRYRSMLTALRDDHRGRSLYCYLDVSLAETLRRHLTRPQVTEFTAEHMSGWYAAHDVLGWPDELVLPETTGLDEAVEAIAAAAGLPQTGRDDDLLPNVPSLQSSSAGYWYRRSGAPFANITPAWPARQARRLRRRAARPTVPA